MKIPPFRLERYFARYEFSAPYLLSSSDCESRSAAELFAMSPGSAEAFQQLWLGYTESSGHPDLRAEISCIYPGLDASQVLVHSGAEEAIYLFANAMLEQGDHVIVHYPCYQSLYQIASSIGCEITPWSGKPEQGWRLDLDELKTLLRPTTRAVIVNFPHNPTGYCMNLPDWLELNRMSSLYGFYLFSDEVYRFLEYDPGDILPAACTLSERAVSLNVLSKAFGLAGLRIGWIATQDATVYQRIAAQKDYTTICNSAPSEFLGLLALQHRAELVSRNLEIIARNLVLLDDFFARRQTLFEWVRPFAGPIAFPTWKGSGSAASFCLNLVEQAGVMLLPGDLYDPAYARHFRIGFGRKNMPEALVRLEAFLDQNQEVVK